MSTTNFSVQSIIKELENHFITLNNHFYGGSLKTPIISIAPNNRKFLCLGEYLYKFVRIGATNPLNADFCETEICSLAHAPPTEIVCAILF